MKGPKGCVFSFLVLVLVVGWLMIHAQKRRDAQALAVYYTSVLTQAPCLENVCPGIDEGRDRVLKQLSSSKIIKRATTQGYALIGFALASSDAGTGGGSGGVYFTPDPLGNPKTVRRISFRLDTLDLATVLTTLGEPDEYLFIVGCGMGLRVHAKLFYLSRGVEVVVDYVTRRPASQVITNDTPIASIEYFSPTNFQNHLLESLDWYIIDSVAYDLHSFVTADDFIGQIRPWPGLGASPTPTADFCPR